MPRQQNAAAKLERRQKTALAAHSFTATVDHIDVPNKRAYIIRPLQTKPDTQGYVMLDGVLAQLAPGRKCHVNENGGSLVIVGGIDS